MAMGYDYCCQECGHEWMLFSKWFTIGPVQWGESKCTCLSCQTFLSIAASVDANSWSVWRRNHETEVERNASLSNLARSIDSRFAKRRGLTPIEVHFDSIECPTCQDAMSAVPFGQHLMKCPECGQFTGISDDSNGISTYGCVEDDAGNAT